MDGSESRRGDASEALVASDILRNGHNVAYPHGHEQKYDLIIDPGCGLFRIQVKTARSIDQFHYEMTVDKGRYPEGTTDIFAGAIHEEGDVMYVSYGDMGPRQTVNYKDPDEMNEHNRDFANLPEEFAIDVVLDEFCAQSE
jgi:hypothetical protein